MKKCIKCNKYKLDKAFLIVHKKYLNSYCKVCAIKLKKIYMHSKKWKDYIKSWRQSKLGKKWYKEYKQSLKYKIWLKNYYKSENYKKISHKASLKWQQSFKGKLSSRRRAHNRRLKTKDLTIKIIKQVYSENVKKYGILTCYLCLKSIIFNKEHLEHKTPLSRKGTNKKTNLGISCTKCNLNKKSMTVKEFKKYKKEKNENN